MYESNLQKETMQVSIGFFGWHTHIQFDMGGTFEAFGWNTRDNGIIVLVCQKVKMWVWDDRYIVHWAHY